MLEAHVVDVHEYDLGDAGKLPAEAYQASLDLLADESGWDLTDVEDVLGKLIQILGPTIVATFVRELMTRNRPLMLGIAPVDYFGKIIKDQDERLSVRISDL